MAQQWKQFPEHIIFEDVYNIFLDKVYLIFTNLNVIGPIEWVESLFCPVVH